MPNADRPDEHAPAEARGPERPGFIPSAWLAIYSLTFVLGGLYLLPLVAADSNKFRWLTAVFAGLALLTGILLWFRQRLALRLYAVLAIGFLMYAVLRVAIDGFTTGRLAIAAGGLLMLVGYSSVAEELPPAGPK